MWASNNDQNLLQDLQSWLTWNHSPFIMSNSKCKLTIGKQEHRFIHLLWSGHGWKHEAFTIHPKELLDDNPYIKSTHNQNKPWSNKYPESNFNAAYVVPMHWRNMFALQRVKQCNIPWEPQDPLGAARKRERRNTQPTNPTHPSLGALTNQPNMYRPTGGRKR